MNENKQIFRMASDSIRAVLENKLSAEVALAQWPVMIKSSHRLMKKAYHLLHHFSSDEDIRVKDVDYAASQRKLLEKCAEDLWFEAEEAREAKGSRPIN